MKFIILLMIWSNFSKADEYVLPKDVVVARDKALIALELYKNSMLKRYIILKKKKKLTIAEEREFVALDAIILNKDLNKTEEILMRRYQKNP